MPEKVYLGTAEGDFKKRYYNHRKSFKNRLYECDTTLSKYIWEIRDKYAEEPTLKWSIVKRVPSYSNIMKRCMLYFQESLKLSSTPDQMNYLTNDLS